MNKTEALQRIRNVKGYVPYIAMFDLYNETDEIPQKLIDLECSEDKAPGTFIITSGTVAKEINKIIEQLNS